jgi:hypothetical protein
VADSSGKMYMRRFSRSLIRQLHVLEIHCIRLKYRLLVKALTNCKIGRYCKRILNTVFLLLQTQDIL